MKLLAKKETAKADTEEKKERPGRPLKAAPETPVDTGGKVSRREFDALQERVTALERLFSESGYVQVPGLTAVDHPENPGKHIIDIDKDAAARWTEPEMIAAGTYFGLDLTAFRGQPREIRRRLHEEMLFNGVEIAKV